LSKKNKIGAKQKVKNARENFTFFFFEKISLESQSVKSILFSFSF